MIDAGAEAEVWRRLEGRADYLFNTYFAPRREDRKLDHEDDPAPPPTVQLRDGPTACVRKPSIEHDPPPWLVKPAIYTKGSEKDIRPDDTKSGINPPVIQPQTLAPPSAPPKQCSWCRALTGSPGWMVKASSASTA